MKKTLIYYILEVALILFMIKVVFNIGILKDAFIGSEKVAGNIVAIVLAVYFILVIGLYFIAGINVYQQKYINMDIHYWRKYRSPHTILFTAWNVFSKLNFLLLTIIILLMNSVDYSGEMDITEIRKIRINYILMLQDDHFLVADTTTLDDDIDKQVKQMVSVILDQKNNLQSGLTNRTTDVVKKLDLTVWEQIVQFSGEIRSLLQSLFSENYEDLVKYKEELKDSWYMSNDIHIDLLSLSFEFQPAIDSITNKSESTSLFNHTTKSVTNYNSKNGSLLISTEFIKIETRHSIDVSAKITDKDRLEGKIINPEKIFDHFISSAENHPATDDITLKYAYNYPYLILKPILHNVTQSISLDRVDKNPNYFEHLKIIGYDLTSNEEFRSYRNNTIYELVLEELHENASDHFIFKYDDELENIVNEKQTKNGILGLISNQLEQVIDDKNVVGYFDARIKSPVQRLENLYILFAVFILIKLTRINSIPDYSDKTEDGK